MTTTADIIATTEPVAPPARPEMWGYGYWYAKCKSWITQTVYSERSAREFAAEHPHGFVFSIPGDAPPALAATRAAAIRRRLRDDPDMTPDTRRELEAEVAEHKDREDKP